MNGETILPENLTQHKGSGVVAYRFVCVACNKTEVFRWGLSYTGPFSSPPYNEVESLFRGYYTYASSNWFRLPGIGFACQVCAEQALNAFKTDLRSYPRGVEHG